VGAVAAITGPFPKAGVIVVAALTAAALIAGDRRGRAATMLGAVVLAPVLLLDEIWHSPQLHLVHRHPLVALVGAVIAIALLAAAARLLARRPSLFALLAIAALPFRVPIQAGGSTSNLLVPLYLVVAAGSLAYIVPALLGRAQGLGRALGPRGEREPDGGERGPERGEREPDGGEREPDGNRDRDPAAVKWLERLLALYIVLYALQSVYSTDFETALQQMVFFYVPFALLYSLLREVRWTQRLVRTCVRLVAVLAVAFSGIGFVEYVTKTIILNPKLVVANDLHTYFTVNSVFFDPDIFGRFLALVMILLACVLLFGRDRREQIASGVVLAVLWVGLVLTLSRSSLAALLVGLAVLAAMRWRPSRALVAVVAVVAVGAVAVLIAPNTFGLNQGLNGASSGRGGLISGGASLFADRPVWGFGSGSFVKEYRAHHHNGSQTLSASHTIPITIAAEQGLIGEIAYIALVLAAFASLLRGARGDPVRTALAAAFIALAFHTLLYADFLEDPVTWALLGVGVALARDPLPLTSPGEMRAGALATAAA
jgi:putative inorganic carbon (HCO3(-)) transporter